MPRVLLPAMRAAGHHSLCVFEEKRLRGLRTDQRFARRPFVIVLVHVRVIFDLAAKGAVEIPEPVRAELMATGAPGGLEASPDKAGSRQHQLGRPAHMEGHMF